MDPLLHNKTDEVVHRFLADKVPFTTTDISNAVKEAIWNEIGQRVGHRAIRAIIQQIDAQGIMSELDFAVSPITVYPPGQGGITVRLWHHHTYNPDDYKNVEQKPWEPPNDQSGCAPQLDMSDAVDVGDSMPIVANTSTGSKATKQCQIQQKQNTLNIPSVLVRSAGFHIGDRIFIDVNPQNGLEISRTVSSHASRQCVDEEGRIRIHGKKLDCLQKRNGSYCTAMLVEEPGKTYIVVQ
jgi:hypothetical protein